MLGEVIVDGSKCVRSTKTSQIIDVAADDCRWVCAGKETRISSGLAETEVDECKTQVMIPSIAACAQSIQGS
jgi:hypothetical protein